MRALQSIILWKQGTALPTAPNHFTFSSPHIHTACCEIPDSRHFEILLHIPRSLEIHSISIKRLEIPCFAETLSPPNSPHTLHQESRTPDPPPQNIRQNLESPRFDCSSFLSLTPPTCAASLRSFQRGHFNPVGDRGVVQEYRESAFGQEYHRSSQTNARPSISLTRIRCRSSHR